MKKNLGLFNLCCILVFFIFTVFMFWYLPSMFSIHAKTAEIRRNLETSIGREGKQQDEYDQAVAELPLVQNELQEKEPLAEQAEQNVADLKSRRKELRELKQKMETDMLSVSPEKTVSGEEAENNE